MSQAKREALLRHLRFVFARRGQLAPEQHRITEEDSATWLATLAQLTRRCDICSQCYQGSSCPHPHHGRRVLRDW